VLLLDEKAIRDLIAKNKIERETEKVEFKTSGIFSNQNKIAQQLVAFANRNGGYLLIGINDDGTIEGAKLKPDQQKLQISHIAENCSPSVEISSFFFELKEGDILVIQIHPQSDIPHAIVSRNKSNKIIARTYYYRTISGTKLVPDTHLKWLFSSKREPNISVKFPSIIVFDIEPYNNYKPYSDEIRDYYEFHIEDLPVIKSQNLFSSFLNDIKKENLDTLWDNEGRKFKEVLLEIFPFIFLKSLAVHFCKSWTLEIKQKRNQLKTQVVNCNAPHETIALTDIKITNETSILKSFSSELNELLSFTPSEIVLPKGTKVEITYKKSEEKQLSKLMLVKDNTFTIEIKFKLKSPQETEIHNFHPYAIEPDYFGPPDDYYYQRRYYIFDIELKSSLLFLEEDMHFEFHEDFLNNINKMIRILWDWDYLVDNLPVKESYPNREITMKLNHIIREISELKGKMN